MRYRNLETKSKTNKHKNRENLVSLYGVLQQCLPLLKYCVKSFKSLKPQRNFYDRRDKSWQENFRLFGGWWSSVFFLTSPFLQFILLSPFLLAKEIKLISVKDTEYPLLKYIAISTLYLRKWAKIYWRKSLFLSYSHKVEYTVFTNKQYKLK